MKEKRPSDLKITTGSISKYMRLFLMISACLILLNSSVMAVQDNANDSSDDILQDKSIPLQAGVTEFSHLIEIHFQDNDLLIVSESIVYSLNMAAEELVLWVPENAQILQFQVTDMAGTASVEPVDYERSGDLVYFRPHEDEDSGRMPKLYGIRYVIQDSGEHNVFRKVLRHQGSFGYPISRLIITVGHDEGKVAVIRSGDGVLLQADEMASETDHSSYIWHSPQFDEFSITLKDHGVDRRTEDGYTGIIAGSISIIVIAIFLHRIYRKKSSIDPDMLEELENLYDAELAIIKKIKEDWEKNKLSKEEFEDLHQKYTDNAAKTRKRIEKLKKS
ncbi:MAG: hypothetical protein QCH31_11380 [Methanolobus sp.]|nr:hypothetical protein [Methanolobus sp.]